MDKFIKVMLILLIVAALGLGVYVLVTYGGKPITEIPSWAVRFFLKR